MSALLESTIRRGRSSDEQWLFQLFKSTMQDFIDAAWGWQELFQKEGFVTSLPAKNFFILESNDEPIACLHTTDKADHLLLDMILVEPSWQQQGYGTQLMSLAMQEAEQKEKPIRLSVLKSNPAVKFHQKIGFNITDEDEHSFHMEWLAH